MPVTINGTTGIAGVDGSAGTPAVQGADSNTGIFFPAADTIAFAEGGAEVARFDSSGNFGIGVTPSAWGTTFYKALQLPGGAISSYSNANIELYQNAFDSGNGAWKYIANGNANRYALVAGENRWFTAASGTAGNAISFTQAMTLDSSGNLLVGTTTANAKIAVGVGQQVGYYANKPSAGGHDHAQYLTDGTVYCKITNVGNLQNFNNSYGSISDIKLKENIVDATPKLEKLNQVRIVNFNLIGSEQKQIGVIAQELEQIFPGMVEDTPDRDDEGNDLGTTTKSVKYSVFVPMLIKAMQEQQTLIESLTARIAALEAA